ncbi:MAG: NAD(P)-dependent oxidoreductase [Pseudomonadota bacterium]
MLRVLITGAGGFIGRHVAQALEGKAEVVSAHYQNRRVDLLEAGAATDLIARTRPQILIHLAWETEHGQFWHSAKNVAWQEASTALFETFFATGGTRALGLGTCAEYDWSVGVERLAEDAPLAPHTAYGTAKVATAKALAETAERHDASWAWGRVFFTFGSGEPQRRLVPLMLRAVLDKEVLDVGPGATKRDFWDVRDLGAAIAALAVSDVEGPVNLASGDGFSFSDLAAIIQDLVGASGLIRPDRRELGPGEPLTLVADASRLRNELGFQPTISLKQGLSDYLATMR